MPPRVGSIGITGMPTLAPGAGRDFIPHSQRYAVIEVSVDFGNLLTLPDRMQQHFHAAIVIRLGEVAHAVVEAAKRKLKKKPDDVITPDGNIYGLDTGKMHNTLTAVLVDMVEEGFTAYDLLSEEADYWQWVEFGHMLRNGNWWPGYRFLSSTVVEMQPQIRQAVRYAWSDTIQALAYEARVPGLLSR